MSGQKTKRNILIIAALLGLVTSLLTYRFLQAAQARDLEKRTPVVVTTQDIDPRTVITVDMVTTVPTPVSQVSDDACVKLTDVIDKVALTRIERSSAIKTGDIATKGMSLGLSYVIPPFMRAVTVAVDSVSGVAGYLKPGDHVDVVVAIGNMYNQDPVAKTVLQDIQLLAIGSQTEKERMKKDGTKQTIGTGKDTATLLVTPSDAEKLVLAETQGKLRLILRASGDIAKFDSRGAAGSVRVPDSQVTGETRNRNTRRDRPQSNKTRTASTPSASDKPSKDSDRASSEETHKITVISGGDVETVEVNR